MRNPVVFFFVAMLVASAWAQNPPTDLVLVEGGPFQNAKSNYFGKNARVTNVYIGKPEIVADFYLGKYEVTQKQWTEVMGQDPSQFKGDNLPVETVSWYDCVEYCNKRSIKEGLRPFYSVNKENKDPANRTAIDDIRWTVTINPGANGYRLPTEVEWEYAAGGGRMSKSFTYSGSDNIDRVGWYWMNSGDKRLSGFWLWPRVKNNHDRSHPIGAKEPNELGLYDMSGNVREWCWDWYGALGTVARGSSSETGRVWRGGGWLGDEECCESHYRGSFEANGKGPDQGLRVCRDK